MKDQALDAFKLEVLKAQMNPHFLFNTFNAIQCFILMEEKQKAVEYFSKFGRLMRHYLSFLENPNAPIGSVMETTKLLLELQKVRYVDKFEFELSCKGCDDENGPKMPSLLIPALVESVVEKLVASNYTSRLYISGERSEELIHFHLRYAISTQFHGFRYSGKQVFLSWDDQIQQIEELLGIEIQKYTTERPLEDIAAKEVIIKLAIPTTK